MREDIAKAWVEDLRNPENQQTQGRLFDGSGFCCLGRLCVVLGKGFERSVHGYYAVAGTDADGLLPASLRNEAGMQGGGGHLTDGERIKVGEGKYGSLTAANDAGCTFSEIADAIERDWRRL